MTQIITTNLVCDLCGADIYGPDRRLYAPGAHQPIQMSGAMFRAAASAGGIDLCDDCAAPLVEAVRDRALVLQAEGKLKRPS